MTLVDEGNTQVDEENAGIDEEVVGADEALDVLLTHAPILRFDARELFSPTDVDGYVAAATLCDRHGPVGQDVSVDELDQRWSAGTYLQLVSDDDRRRLAGADPSRISRRLLSLRLGRVGLFGRVLDALFMLSVWLRPTVPRRTTEAAVDLSRHHDLERRPVCYGRTARAGEWLVLHYAYFYIMNDWRSSYGGLNDHEADWEQAWIFVDPATMQPVWIAASNHDYDGGDLRRHWDDPEVNKIDGRPVLFAAAGSHALYFRSGEYVSRIDVPAMRWLLRLQRLLGAARGLPRDRRGQGPALGVPFIDSALGDGRSIDEWDLRLMTVNDGWVESFRGLWGVDTGDPLQAERGPGGPKFDRSGQVRASWADPSGFAGLHGTPPPSAMAARVNLGKIDRAMAELDQQIRSLGRLLPLANQTERGRQLAKESGRLTELLRQQCELRGLRRRIAAGHAPIESGIRDHLRHPAVPLSNHGDVSWMLTIWAVLSVPALLTAAAVSILVGSVKTMVVLPAVLAAVFLVESLVHRRFQAAIWLATADLAVVGLVLFALGFVADAGRYIVGGLLVVAAVSVVTSNASELLAIRTFRSTRSQ